MNTKNNRRSRGTEEAIVRAVYKGIVVDKKPLNRVTVREVCESAGINRSTFYAHFMDVYDVVESAERTMSQMLAQSFLQKLEAGESARACFTALFAFIAEYREFYAVYLSQTGKPGVIGLAWELFQDKLEGMSYADFGYRSQREMEYHGTSFLFGLSAMVRAWLEADCPESPEEMANILWRQYVHNDKLLGMLNW